MFDREKLVALKQPHIAEKWAEWGGAKQEDFARAIEDTPLQRLVGALEDAATDPSEEAAPSISPPNAVDGTDTTSRESAAAYNHGVDLLQQGKVAILVVAGGMGTRLGWAAPKGTFPVGPVSNRSLFPAFRRANSRAQ